MSYDESMKVSFKESIIRICGEQIKDFVTSCLGERGYTLVGIRSHYFTVLDTVGATVIFSLNVRCLCNCERGGEGELSLFFQGSWDITKKASGMELEKLQKDNPRYKSNGLQYGDDLIPYIKKEKYKDVADLFLKKVYGDFFTNSSKITSALDIAWTLGLTVKMIHLPANMLGKIICRESIVSSTVP
ncbi:MAG: hypothetical protein KBS81_04085, partial [Spirochaetales bacterium]|nr:hypothetical protein [Candidatus Physcosoma equi]